MKLAADGVSGWHVVTKRGGNTIVQDIPRPEYNFTISSDTQSVDITAITDINSLPVVDAARDAAPVYYDVMGVGHSSPVRGVNIVRDGSGIRKILQR